MPTLRTCLRLLTIAWLLTGAAWAQAPPPGLERAEVEAARKEVERSTLEATVKKALLQVYDEALAELGKREVWTKQALDAQNDLTAIPERIKALKAELATPVKPVPAPPADAGRAALEKALAEAEAEGQAADKRLAELEAESARIKEQLAEQTRQIPLAAERLARLTEELKVAPDPTPAGKAAAMRTRARFAAASAEVDARRKELARLEAQRELQPLLLDQAKRRKRVADQRIETTRKLAADARQREAGEATREAERLRAAAIEQFPRLESLANELRELATLRAGKSGTRGTADQLKQIELQLGEARRKLARAQEDYRQARRRVRAAGMTNSMGLLLRRGLDRLPSLPAMRRAIAERRETISDLQLQLVIREEQRGQIGDTDQLLGELVGGRRTAPELKATARELLEARRDNLDGLIGDYNQLFARLVELNTIEHQLVSVVGEFRAYIEERILWVPSVTGPKIPDLAQAREATTWLVSPTTLRVIGTACLAVVVQWRYALAGLLLLGLLVVTRAASYSDAKRHVDIVERDTDDCFSHTARALGYVAVWAIAIFALVYGFGWLLVHRGTRQLEAVALGAGLMRMARVLLVFEVIRCVMRPRGLGEVHFRWPASTCAYFRWHLRWFIPIQLAATLHTGAMDAQPNNLWNDALGRIAFVVGVLALALVLQRLLRPRGPVFAPYFAERCDGWLSLLSYPGYLFAIGVPLSLAVLALDGYYYTAHQLESRLHETLWLVVGLALTQALLSRWLRVARRRLLEEAAAEEAANAAAAALSEDGTVAPVGAESAQTAETAAPPPPRPTEERLPVPTIDAQTQQVFRSGLLLLLVLGLALIWVEVLPALKQLRRVSVWPTVGLLAGPDEEAISLDGATPPPVDKPAAGAGSPGAAPAKTPESTPSPKPSPTPKAKPGAKPAAPVKPASPAVVTLADLGLGLLILGFTLILAKNVPGLLEILLLGRLPMDAGGRYAASTIARYLILLVGIPSGLSAVGLRWDSIQWLAAALTFGLAFGLQEIFANLVSGLIILFERPVRVGDLVTVSGTSGTVSRIRMRATIITDFDHKELIVPNKQFVTGAVVNWALSNERLRVVIPLGVAYGTDMQRLQEILLEEATRHELVLADPAPTAWFTGLGDSALTCEVRVFVSPARNKTRVQHDLLDAIHRRLNEEGIEIVFPQRDLHLRSAVPLRLVNPPAKDDDPS